jgi:quaternary ammonium compound-resistance protein SugE
MYMSLTTAWLLLVIGGLFETGWAVGLKYTEGFTRFWPSVGTAAAMVISVWLLAIAMKVLPLGTAYAIWVGIGAVGAVIIGIVLFGDSTSVPRLVSVMLIIAGIIGLKLFS